MITIPPELCSSTLELLNNLLSLPSANGVDAAHYLDAVRGGGALDRENLRHLAEFLARIGSTRDVNEPLADDLRSQCIEVAAQLHRLLGS